MFLIICVLHEYLISETIYRRQIDIVTYQIRKIKADTSLYVYLPTIQFQPYIALIRTNYRAQICKDWGIQTRCIRQVQECHIVSLKTAFQQYSLYKQHLKSSFPQCMMTRNYCALLHIFRTTKMTMSKNCFGVQISINIQVITNLKWSRNHVFHQSMDNEWR